MFISIILCNCKEKDTACWIEKKKSTIQLALFIYVPMHLIEKSIF